MLPDQVDWYAFYNEGAASPGGASQLIAKHVAYGVGETGIKFRIVAGSGLITESVTTRQQLGSTVRLSKSSVKVNQ